ncbi:MAG: TSUP family transporter [Clostridia bacterium]|nr:TSUP family transporter [Clostridia bacterium]
MAHSSRLRLPYLTPTVGLLLALGGGAGFINGLLGTGGGILLVLVLQTYVRRHTNAAVAAEAQRDVFATALSVMLPISVLSTILYARGGTLDLGGFAPMILPTVLGGVLGAFLLDKLRLDWLKRLFSLLLLVSGVLMVVRV